MKDPTGFERNILTFNPGWDVNAHGEAEVLVEVSRYREVLDRQAYGEGT